MFSKASKPAPGAAAPGGSESKQGGGKQGGGKQGGSGIPSIISADLKVEGNLTSNGDIQIDGTVEGDVTSHVLTVGEGATVHGALEAETIRIYGTVKGTLTANSVILTVSAKVDGDITHGTLAMEAGASFAGQIKRLERPIGSSAGAKVTSASDEKSSPSSYGSASAKPYST